MKGLPDFEAPDEESGIISRVVYFCHFSRMNPQKTFYSFLWIGLVGFGYVIYEVFPSSMTYIFLSGAILYTSVIVLSLLNLQGHFPTAQQGEETAKQKDEPSESRHFICTSPWECGRCWGYYIGLSTTVTSSLELHPYLVKSFKELGANPWTAILFGFGVFLLTTPIHGAIGTVMRTLLPESSYKRSTNSNTLKFGMGFVSGLSLLLVLIGFLVILPK